jgi:hypothetical protein
MVTFAVSRLYTTTTRMKKLYALKRNGQEIVTVEMDVPDFITKTTLNREWLKGVVTEELAKQPTRNVRNARPAKLVKVHA